MHQQPRRSLIGARADDSWEALDRSILVKDKEVGREHYLDGVELFF